VRVRAKERAKEAKEAKEEKEEKEEEEKAKVRGRSRRWTPAPRPRCFR
jgi:hypothetical protein